jgi:hypothetical protein
MSKVKCPTFYPKMYERSAVLKITAPSHIQVCISSSLLQCDKPPGTCSMKLQWIIEDIWKLTGLFKVYKKAASILGYFSFHVGPYTTPVVTTGQCICFCNAKTRSLIIIIKGLCLEIDVFGLLTKCLPPFSHDSAKCFLTRSRLFWKE